MKNKSSTPIGFIIELLNISVKKMAAEIFVDPTTISKWKSCERPLSSKCDSFEKVVDYVLEKNYEQNHQMLENLFSNLYGEIEGTDDYLRHCLCRFMENAQIPVAARNLLAQTKGGLYCCSTTVFSDNSGRKTAMDMLLNEAEAMNEPSQVTLFDRQLFSWLLWDEQYSRNWHQRISTLLSKGWKVSIILDCSSPSSLLGTFMRLSDALFIYPTYKTYHFVFDKNINLLPTTYALQGIMAIVGYNEKSSVYTSIFRDRFSIEHCQYYLKSLISECVATVSPENLNERIKLLQKITALEMYEAPAYLISAYPSLITMDKNMLCDILRENSVQGQMKTTIIGLHKALQSAVLSTKNFYRQLLFTEYIVDSLNYERISHQALSNLIGREIYISNCQYRESLRNAAQYILKQDFYSIAIFDQFDRIPAKRNCFRCKERLYEVSNNSNTVFNEANSIVTTYFKMMDDYWKNGIGTANKDKEFVAKYLLEMADK